MTRQGTRLGLVAGTLAVVVAGLHLYWGMPRFAVYVTVGTMPDPRPLAFVLSGHAILVGVTLVAIDRLDRQRLYLPGMVLLVMHLLGYAAWHTVFRHGFVESSTGHTHDSHGLVDAGVVVLEHVVNSPLAFASKFTELVLLGCLAVLYVYERRS